jgi:alkylated DNA repair dioxygenase AlkB
MNGYTYLPDFISEQEERDLLDIIDSQPWATSLRRRTQHYGYRYDYTRKTADKSDFLGALPEWLAPLLRRLSTEHFTIPPEQVIINEYLPGQGIGRHIDCVKCFGETVASLSLGSTCTMELEKLDGSKKESAILAPRSLLILLGEARYDWMHSIPANKTDSFNGEILSRSRRVSLTFRTMILDKI